ncbi:MAG: NERD domain-containing protein [Proteobacteria bacterium]|nr:NERD domain-containing protein [Patescibacteria group bacterium]MBU4582858.1 NERD domain-containing protein [Pseudomonadota bacterium]
MATMIPNEVNAFTTDGERTFYRFLQSCAKPDDRYTAWYLPDILGREPDFLLYAPDAGLVILEVKDWALDQIIAADPQFFTLYMAGKEERRKNPLQQIREYFGQVLEGTGDSGAGARPSRDLGLPEYARDRRFCGGTGRKRDLISVRIRRPPGSSGAAVSGNL